VTTPVCELLGIEQPIVQAPMAAVPRLAAAVSNAGALGIAAGGIGDARGVAAVLALGAQAAWPGTRFLLAAGRSGPT
jgi:nitronate monooxygenase